MGVVIGIACFILVVNIFLIVLVLKKEAPIALKTYKDLKKNNVEEAKKYKRTAIRTLMKNLVIHIFVLMFVFIYITLDDNGLI